MISLMSPAWRREPLDKGVFVRGIAEGLDWQTLQHGDESRADVRHPPKDGPKPEAARSGDGPRVEAIRVGHVAEPTNAVAVAAGDEPESAHGLLVTGQQMAQDVLDRPAVLRVGPQDLASGQPRDERQRGFAGRHDAPHCPAPPPRERRGPPRSHDGSTLDQNPAVGQPPGDNPLPSSDT
jgi:hypothetical protein